MGRGSSLKHTQLSAQITTPAFKLAWRCSKKGHMSAESGKHQDRLLYTGCLR